MISIIIPANNEEIYIATCLEALLAQKTDQIAEVIVAANACTDRTQKIVLGYRTHFLAKGWVLKLLDIEMPGKTNALNCSDAAASGDARLYLDADVTVSPGLIGDIAEALEKDRPVYASGRLKLVPAKSRITRAYGRIWSKLPFMTHGVAGAGLFAVNAAARARWESFPEIISDDTYVRLQFAPKERVLVDASYNWPLVEGFAALVRVRRRQNRGVLEVCRIYPELANNNQEPGTSLSRASALAFADPLGFLVYIVVVGLAKLPGGAENSWSRGR